jgi:two-component system, OmpR family, sensor kinase
LSAPGARRSQASRLVLRIYLVMIVAIAVVVAVLIIRTPEPPTTGGLSFETVVQAVAQYRDDPEALGAELARVKRDNHLEVTLYGPGGRLIGSSAQNPPHPASDEELQRIAAEGPRARFRGPSRGPAPRFGPVERLARPGGGPPGGRPRMVIPLSPAGDHAIVEFERRGPPDLRLDILVVLFTLGIASLVLARMIARPVRHIAAAARAFGAGDLVARSRLRRRDELGELSRTFDEMADRITQLLRGQRELLASISHELRTPLSRIRVALDLAAEGDDQSLRDITEDLGELEELVNDVLAMARLEAQVALPQGIPRLRTQEVDARAVAEKAVARFAGSHADRTLDVRLGAAGEPPIPIEADSSLLRRVIGNLLENAHKYSPPEAPIRLTLASDDGNAVFTVVDRGQGIGSEDLPHVFEPFFRADRSRTRETGGVGLGLALSRRVVEAHGGRIEIESEIDEGTAVTFTIPLAGRAAPEPGEAA